MKQNWFERLANALGGGAQGQGAPLAAPSTHGAGVYRTAGIVLYVVDARDRGKHDWRTATAKRGREFNETHLETKKGISDIV